MKDRRRQQAQVTQLGAPFLDFATTVLNRVLNAVHQARGEGYATGTYCSDVVETYADAVVAWREFLTVLSPTSREVALYVSAAKQDAKGVCNVRVESGKSCTIGSLGHHTDQNETLAATVRVDPDESGRFVIVSVDIKGHTPKPGLYIGDLKVDGNDVADVYVQVS